MPVSYIQKLSKKHNIPVNDLESIWNMAKYSVKDHNNWGAVTNIFKNMINKKYNINEKSSLSFDEFRELYEEFEEQIEIPTKEIQDKNLESHYNETVS